jgi:hypothetical protein
MTRQIQSHKMSFYWPGHRMARGQEIAQAACVDR